MKKLLERALLGAALLTGSQAQADVTLLNVSYDPTRELYQEYNAAFAKADRVVKYKAVVNRVTAAANPAKSASFRSLRRGSRSSAARCGVVERGEGRGRASEVPLWSHAGR